MRDALRRVLKKRFKKVPDSVEAKLAAADPDTLTQWFDAALDAKSLKSLGL